MRHGEAVYNDAPVGLAGEGQLLPDSAQLLRALGELPLLAKHRQKPADEAGDSAEAIQKALQEAEDRRRKDEARRHPLTDPPGGVPPPRPQ